MKQREKLLSIYQNKGRCANFDELGITIANIRDFVGYNELTGEIYWKPRPADWFISDLRCRQWNTRYAGKPAFYEKHSSGYRKGTLYKKALYAHRIAFAIYHGYFPEEEIDHINGNRCDNRIKNLRVASHAQNAQNTRLRVDNTSGHVGVCFVKGKWLAYIGVNKEHIWLGCHTNKSSAISARKAAEIKYGFHENHGESWRNHYE